MSRVAAIDIGTNTFLCLIADVEHGIVKTISDHVNIVRLGEKVNQNRAFLPAALDRADKCLSDFSKIMSVANVEKCAAVATSAARDAKNASELFRVAEKYKIPIEVIGGEREAKLTFKGVCTNSKFDNDIVVIDVGGGSTEITFKESSGNLRGKSFDLGGVRLTEMFVTQFPTPKQELEKMREYARAQFSVLQKMPGRKVVAVAGTPTTLAALDLQIDYTQESIEGFDIELPRIDFWIEKLAALSLEERSKLKGLEPKRADIIVAGAIAQVESARALGAKSITVSTRGVRYGLAAELA